MACGYLQCYIVELGLETPSKEQKLGKKILQNLMTSKDGPVKYRNKAGIKIRQKTTLLRNNSGKERQADHPTPAASGVQ